MPAPTKAQLEPTVKGLMQQSGLQGENAPDLAGAIAEVVAGALSAMASQVQVAPGIPSTPAATAGPGRLI